MNRIRDLLIFALSILLALAPAVSANSGPTSWRGTTASGMVVTGDSCPIEVVHEDLTFRITELPEAGSWDTAAFESYSDHVTAQYTFHNPTDADVTATLLFPFGFVPDYAPTRWTPQWQYTVTADGEPVQTVLRHSLDWGDEFVMVEDSARLYDDFMEHPFYSREMTVTKHVYRPEGVDWEEYNSIRAMLRLDSDPAYTKYLLDPANSFGVKEDHATAGSSLRESDVAELYIIGRLPDSGLSWTLSKRGEPIEGTMELVDVEEMTLEEYLLSDWEEDSGVSRVDLYNASVQMLDRVENAFGYLSAGFRMELMRWYQYELTIPAGETLVNTVTAPLYPDINSGWEPAVYTYRYLLSPARGWADFGTLNIRVETPFYMTQCNLGEFEKTEAGYILELDSLPPTEMEFVLSTDANPDKPGTHAEKMLLLFAGIGVLLVTGLIRLKRKK